MRQGRLYTVVGASGVGKDTVMAALARARPALHWVRRVITRPEAAGGEPFEGVNQTEFATRLEAGEFALHWDAHGLRYGVPASVRDVLAAGHDAMFNGSRAVLDRAAVVFPGLHVLHITASDAVRAERLAARGRESAEDIARRIARVTPPFPECLDVTEINNSGALEASVADCLQVLDQDPVRHVERT